MLVEFMVFTGSFQSSLMHMPGKVNRTFSIYGVPSGGVRCAEKFRLQSNADQCFIKIHPFDPVGRFPGGVAGSPISANL